METISTTTSLFISDLLVQSKFVTPIEGEIIGYCVLCMRKTDKGSKVRKIISGNFTAFMFFHAGECLCPNCAGALKTPGVRRQNWIITPKGFFTPKRMNFLHELERIINQGDLFAAFVSKSFKKHGWLVNINAVNTSKNQFIVIFEEEVARFTQKSFQLMKELARRLIPAFGKKRLISLEVSPPLFEILLEHSLLNLYYKALSFKGNPSWELIVILTESPKKLLTLSRKRKVVLSEG